MRSRVASLALAAALAAPPAAAEQAFNWDSFGSAFCQASAAGSFEPIRAYLSPDLARLIDRARPHLGRPELGEAAQIDKRLLMQAFRMPSDRCAVRTRNVALVEVDRRSGTTEWRDLLVIVPMADGSNRIDDILFRGSMADTLRIRLATVLRAAGQPTPPPTASLDPS